MRGVQRGRTLRGVRKGAAMLCAPEAGHAAPDRTSTGESSDARVHRPHGATGKAGAVQEARCRGRNTPHALEGQLEMAAVLGARLTQSGNGSTLAGHGLQHTGLEPYDLAAG